MDSKLRDLVQALTDKSQRGKVTWSAVDSEAFRTHLGTGRLLVLRTAVDSPVGNGYRYTVNITDTSGRVVVESEATEGQDKPIELSVHQKLFDAARTTALGGYNVIDSMLKALETIA